MSPDELASRMDADAVAGGQLAVVDVRGRAEWEAGHLPGVPNIPLGALPERLAELPRDRPVVLHCQGGSRSAIAASVLRAHGFQDVVNLEGGYRAWEGGGHPVERAGPDEPAESTTSPATSA
jgi:hydroxyacylglutathione hydrolase